MWTRGVAARLVERLVAVGLCLSIGLPAVSLAASTANAFSSIRYVPVSGAGTKTGVDWADAYRRWIGQDALTPTHGWAVFNHERKAVGLLTYPALAGNSTISQAISDLLSADRAIAVKAINEDPDSSEQATGNAKLANADRFISRGRYSRAILALLAAWLAVVYPASSVRAWPIVLLRRYDSTARTRRLS